MDWDWKKVKTEYITTEKSSYRKLAEKYSIPLGTLYKRAKRENWVELKQQSGDRTVAKTVKNIEDKKVDKLTRIQDLTDRLLDKIEQAIDELDIQLYKNVEKVKEIEYNNLERPDKPTKEVIHEEEKVTEIRTIIDRKGVQAIARALNDIKEVQMLKSDLDKREQEARIRNLEKQAEANDDKDTTVIVQFEDDISKWSK